MSNQTSNISIELKVISSIFYSISLLLGISGNLLVLLIIFYYKQINSITNYFIINLALADLIFVILCIPSTYLTAFLMQYWPFSNFLCIFFNYMQTVSVTLTVYTIICISLDKYWHIIKPFRSRMNKKFCLSLIFICWLFSFIFSLPIALFTRLKFEEQNDDIKNIEKYNVFYEENKRPQCVEIWPLNYEYLSSIYNISILCVQYFIPLIVLVYCYIRIGFRMIRSKCPGESIQQRDAKISKSKKKLLKMSFFLVVCFMISWAPLQFLNTYRFFSDSISNSSYFAEIFFICHLFAVSSSYLNPLIYALNSLKFRNGLVYYMSFCKNKKRLNQFSSTTKVLGNSELQNFILTNTNYMAGSISKHSK